jgi:uncharacterized protein
MSTQLQSGRRWTRRGVVAAAPGLWALFHTDLMGANAMSTDAAEVRAAIERYAAAWKSGDLAAIAACYHAEFTLHYFGRNALSGEHAGKARALEVLGEFTRRTKRQLIAIVATLAGHERGAIVVREAMGPKRVEVERVLVYAVAGGLLRECWVYDQDQRAIDEWVGAP